MQFFSVKSFRPLYLKLTDNDSVKIHEELDIDIIIKLRIFSSVLLKKRIPLTSGRMLQIIQREIETNYTIWFMILNARSQHKH